MKTAGPLLAPTRFTNLKPCSGMQNYSFKVHQDPCSISHGLIVMLHHQQQQSSRKRCPLPSYWMWPSLQQRPVQGWVSRQLCHDYHSLMLWHEGYSRKGQKGFLKGHEPSPGLQKHLSSSPRDLVMTKCYTLLIAIDSENTRRAIRGECHWLIMFSRFRKSFHVGLILYLETALSKLL